MLAGTNSGSGKTTLTTAISGALTKAGKNVQCYKCGCDYIDTMLHKKITSKPSFNLDSYFYTPEQLRYILADNFHSDIAIIEGVMGFYDGIGKTSSASSYEIAVITKTPVILILNAKGCSRSVIAVIKGFLALEPDNMIKGVILNNISKGMYNFLKSMIESETGLEVVGYFPQSENFSIESRHLGLITAGEVADEKLNLIAETASETICFEKLSEIAESAEPIEFLKFPKNYTEKFSLAVAFDKAYCFYYEDNLNLLREYGAKIKFFSPLNNEELPNSADGIYIGGGYPEIYAEKLSKNDNFKNSLVCALKNNIPLIAECGGFMTLLNEVCGYEMCGIISGKSFMTDKLKRFGYAEYTSLSDTGFLKAGEKIRGHEFHYTESTDIGNMFSVRKPDGRNLGNEIFMTETMLAGYPHFCFRSNPALVRRFAEACLKYRKEKK